MRIIKELKQTLKRIFMFQLIGLVLFGIPMFFLSTGCNETKYPIYEYTIQEIVPDSLKTAEANFITETMRASDYHLTTSDYEDPEDVLREAHYTFEQINRKPVEGLSIITSENKWGVFIPYYQLDKFQSKIFCRLKVKAINNR